MARSQTRAQELLALAKSKGLVRNRDLTRHRIHREYLRRLESTGQLVRLARGLYAPAEADVTEHHALAEVAARVPRGVVCLLTALRFHQLGTQNPRNVWLAIDRKAARPRIEYPPVRIVRFSGAGLTKGVDAHRVEGVDVKLTSPARTVVDCFKYRNKIGLDVALEALRAYRRRKNYNADDMWTYAKLQRVTKVMQPYLEALS